MQRDFKGIWIPREVWLDKELTLQEKVFLVEIDSLNNERGCYANNHYFSEFFGISTVRVSEVINNLVRKGYVTSDIDQADGNRRILRTLTKVSLRGVTKESLRGSQRKVGDPHKESFIHNNTVSNTDNILLGRRGVPPNLTPINPSLDLELNTWLGAVAVAVGAKDRHSLPKPRKWEQVCMAAIQQRLDLGKFLAIIETEKQRTKGQEEFFSPDTCLQKLQLNGSAVKQSKWTHEV